MEDIIRELQERVQRLEATVAELRANSVARNKGGTQVTAPFEVADAEGKILLKLSSDCDGGYIAITGLDGKANVTLGCLPTGGFIDIHHTVSGRLAMTLVATEEGGNIEITDKDGNYIFDAVENGSSKL